MGSGPYVHPVKELSSEFCIRRRSLQVEMLDIGWNPSRLVCSLPGEVEGLLDLVETVCPLPMKRLWTDASDLRITDGKL